MGVLQARSSFCKAIVLTCTILTGGAGCQDAPGTSQSEGSSSEGPARSGPADAGQPTPDTLDLDAIFPPGPGRELVLANCQSCHVLTPIIILQMNEDEWRFNSENHRGRLENLTDEEYRTLYQYLPKHFGPHRPVPELPQALLEAWTSY